MSSPLPRLTTAILASLAVLSGCALLEPYPDEPADVEPGPELVAVPVAAADKNRFELFYAGQSVIGELQRVTVEGDNTLSDLAREYGLGFDEIVAANPDVDPWLPGVGTEVLLPTQYVLPDTQRSGIVLNIASKRLFYYPPAVEGELPVVYTFPIGIGRVGWETPTGATTVVDKARDPNWYVPASVRREHAAAGNPLPAVVPPGPDNPLGRYVLKLDMPGYLIHGTNQPYGVGMRVSHGCVRLYPENIEYLYPEIGRGEPVEIVNEPYLLGERDGELYFEAHAPLEDDAVAPGERLSDAVAAFAERNRVTIPARAERHIEQLTVGTRGIPLRVYAYDAEEYAARTVAVINSVQPDPDAPTLAEVREMIDAAVAEEDADILSAGDVTESAE